MKPEIDAVLGSRFDRIARSWLPLRRMDSGGQDIDGQHDAVEIDLIEYQILHDTFRRRAPAEISGTYEQNDKPFHDYLNVSRNVCDRGGGQSNVSSLKPSSLRLYPIREIGESLEAFAKVERNG